MAATPQQIQRLHVLLQSDLYKTKKLAFMALLTEDPTVLDGFGSVHSAEMNVLAAYRAQYPDSYHIRGPRGPYGLPDEPVDPDDLDQLDLILDNVREARADRDKPSAIDGWTVQEKLDAADLEIQADNVKLADQLQRTRDINRVANKSWRQNTREYNANEALNNAIARAIDRLPECFVDFPVRTGRYSAEAPVVIAQWSDHHANEVINMGEVNKFDFTIYAKRLEKYVSFLKLQAEAFGAERVVVAMGGDLINSDRLVDEKLTEAANRADALVITAEILFEAIMDLRADFFVDIVGVVGNEGRVGEKQAFAKKAAKYNYDRAVLKVLQGMTDKSNPGDRGLRYFTGDQGVNERTFTVHDTTFLLIHGNQGGVAGGAQKNIQSVIGKYAMAKDMRIDKVLAGHIHSSYAGDFFARNASMAGTNDYSDSLQYASKAAQNLHVVTPNDLFTMVVDLQDYSNFDGYPIEDMLRSFGVQTADNKHLGAKDDDSHVDL